MPNTGIPDWLARASEKANAHLATLSYDQLGPAARLLVRRDNSNVISLDAHPQDPR